jgi:hypothetical protein
VQGVRWRNLLPFDPLVKYGGFSYEDAVVRPASEALRAVIRPDTRVWFMISGEMGRSLWAYPRSYLKLMSKYRGALMKHRPRNSVRMGVALHWNKVCGDCFDMAPPLDTAERYNASYAAAFAARRPQILGAFDVDAIRGVFEAADVIGISHYAPAPAQGVNAGSFSLPIDTTAYELSHWGVDLRVRTGGGGGLGRAAAGAGRRRERERKPRIDRAREPPKPRAPRPRPPEPLSLTAATPIHPRRAPRAPPPAEADQARRPGLPLLRGWHRRRRPQQPARRDQPCGARNQHPQRHMGGLQRAAGPVAEQRLPGVPPPVVQVRPRAAGPAVLIKGLRCICPAGVESRGPAGRSARPA